MDKHKKASILSKFIYIIAAIVFVCSIIRGYTIAGKQTQKQHYLQETMDASGELKDLNDEWILQHENGEQEQISLPYELPLEEEVTIFRDVTGLFHNGDVIKFDNNRQGMVVLADGQVIYEVNTTVLKKQLSFTDYQLVGIPDASEVSEITIKINHSIYDHYLLPVISYGTYRSARNEIVYDDLFTLIILVILSIFFLLVCGIDIFCKINEIMDKRIIDLAIFILAAILWGMTDSYLPILTKIPQEVLGLISYLSIMAVPIPMCHFVWVSCKKKYLIFQIVGTVGALNLILEALLSSFGLFQLHNTFYSAHVMIILVIIISISGIYKTRMDLKSREMDLLYFGIVLLAVIAMLSLIMYWQKGGQHYRICMLIGIMIFSAILFCYVITHYLKRMQEDQIKISEIKIHERLSLFDELTGLPNRRAFEKKLQEVEAADNTVENAVLIMLDVNGLKMVNDKYGHSAGDDLIVSAARVVDDTYGEKGFCFRIGGDEFVVILLDLSIPMTTFDRIFEENIANVNVNSRWKLSIAKGSSYLTDAYGQRLSISDWKQEADINMYRNKVSLSGNKNRDTAKDLTDIIKCIISTIEAKDRYTAAHSERVKELANYIGKKLGLSDVTLRDLEIAAQLHDIGKIGIPDYILLKKGKLTAEEYTIIKEHSRIGYNIILQAKGMKDIADIVLHHHERWDGKGYPEGISREDIPLEARIIALADSIDAITSKRVYRDSMSLDVCREEIEKNTGIMYDPAIAKIVLDNWKGIVSIILMHPKRLIGEE